jgi:hypothetical protein
MAAPVGLSQRHQWRRHPLLQLLMVVATMVSLPPPPTTMTATLALIALALALLQTWIGWWDGGCAVTHLILCCHGCCYLRHLCLHLQHDGAKDNGCGNRRGRHANICGQEEVGHHNPISVEQKIKIKKIKNNISGGC